jgi:hypothetical protein
LQFNPTQNGLIQRALDFLNADYSKKGLKCKKFFEYLCQLQGIEIHVKPYSSPKPMPKNNAFLRFTRALEKPRSELFKKVLYI